MFRHIWQRFSLQVPEAPHWIEHWTRKGLGKESGEGFKNTDTSACCLIDNFLRGRSTLGQACREDWPETWDLSGPEQEDYRCFFQFSKVALLTSIEGRSSSLWGRPAERTGMDMSKHLTIFFGTSSAALLLSPRLRSDWFIHNFWAAACNPLYCL